MVNALTVLLLTRWNFIRLVNIQALSPFLCDLGPQALGVVKFGRGNDAISQVLQVV